MDETLLKVYFLPRIFKRLPEQDVFTTFYKTRRNSQLSLHFDSGEKVSDSISVKLFRNFLVSSFQ